jgi:hypothetical protein
MKTIDNDQIERTLEDIASIKEVINSDYSIIRYIASFTHTRLISLLSGISVIGFSMLFYFLMDYYGNYRVIPTELKWIIYIAIAIDACFLTIMSVRLVWSALKKSDPSLTLSSLFQKKTAPDWHTHIFLSTTFLFFFLIVFFIIKGIPYYIIPTNCLLYGLLAFSNVSLGIKHSLIMGYWCFVTGICLLIFNTIPAPIAVSISMGVGCLIMAVLGYMDQKSGKKG